MKLFLLLIVCYIQAKRMNKRSKAKSIDALDFAQLDQQEIQDHIQVNDELLDIINQQSNDYESKQDLDAESIEFDQLLQQMMSEDDLIQQVEQTEQQEINQQEDPNQPIPEESNTYTQETINLDEIEKNTNQPKEEEYDSNQVQSDQINSNQAQSDQINANQEQPLIDSQSEILTLDQVETVVDYYLNNSTDNISEQQNDQILQKNDENVDNVQNQDQVNNIIENQNQDNSKETQNDQTDSTDIKDDQDVVQQEQIIPVIENQQEEHSNVIESSQQENQENQLPTENDSIGIVQQKNVVEISQDTQLILDDQIEVVADTQQINDDETPSYNENEQEQNPQQTLEQPENNDQPMEEINQVINDQNQQQIAEEIQQSQNIEQTSENLENDNQQQILEQNLNQEIEHQDYNIQHQQTDLLIDPHQQEYEAANNLDQHNHDHDHSNSDHHHHHHHHHHKHDSLENVNKPIEQNIEQHVNEINDSQSACTFENKLHCMGEANEQLINSVETETQKDLTQDFLTMALQFSSISGLPVAFQWGIILNIFLFALAMLKTLLSSNVQTYSIRQENQQDDTPIDTSHLTTKIDLLNTQFSKMSKEHQLITQIINDLQTKVISVLEKKKQGQSSKSLNESDPNQY